VRPLNNKKNLKTQDSTISVKVFGLIEANATGRLGIGAVVFIVLASLATKVWGS
jgi:hypothetical protein